MRTLLHASVEGQPTKPLVRVELEKRRKMVQMQGGYKCWDHLSKEEEIYPKNPDRTTTGFGGRYWEDPITGNRR